MAFHSTSHTSHGDKIYDDRERQTPPLKRRRIATDNDDILQEDHHIRLHNLSYKVGWICALTTEYQAAQSFLDDNYGLPNHVEPNDCNHYTCGRIGKHNVVIAVLPDGEYGLSSASNVVRDMLHSFPSVKFGLMVGIGGGAPSQIHDIRLGDIVVSTPGDGHSGVFQYDFGKAIQDRVFRPTGSLNLPPSVLRTAVSGLKVIHERDGHKIDEAISLVLNKHPNLREKYQRPCAESDRLYASKIIHPCDQYSSYGATCSVSCGNDPSTLIMRPDRSGNDACSVIHYGLIASANKLMKDAMVRDKLSAEKQVLCFEMEAAGLMNNLPFIVIRGICDYSDSHKSKEWQGYAAMAAAAYARDLLLQTVTSDNASEGEHDSYAPRIVTQIKQQDQERAPSSLTSDQRKLLMESLRFDQIEARHLTIRDAHSRTCKWILKDTTYEEWSTLTNIESHHGFLWIKGNPGTGKSTIMKFAYGRARKSMRSVVIAFFFNARGDHLEKSTVGMYRSLLLQLFERLPNLQITFDSLGLTAFKIQKHLEWSLGSLKAIFREAIQSLDQSSVVCFIDALDECGEEEIRDMVSFFEQLGDLTVEAGIKYQVCFSSRHYPYITLRNELELVLEGQEGHRQDIINYVDSELRVGGIKAAPAIRTRLEQKSSGIFMWVVLVVDILNREYDKGRTQFLQQRLEELPKDLHKLFQDILTRDQNNRDELLLCIQWVSLARRPLRPEELYFAILSGTQPNNLAPWDREDFPLENMGRYILDCSKGLVETSKSKNPTVQFIHVSVRDFFLKENGFSKVLDNLTDAFGGNGHERLTRCCINYMGIDISPYFDLTKTLPKASSEEASCLRLKISESFPLLEYAVHHIIYHSNAAEYYGSSQRSFLPSFPLNRWRKLHNLLEKHTSRQYTHTASLLYILAENDSASLIKIMPDNTLYLQVEDDRYGCPLLASLAMGCDTTIRVFMDIELALQPQSTVLKRFYSEHIRDKIIKTGLTRKYDYSKKFDIAGDIARAPMVYMFLLEAGRVNLAVSNRHGRTPLSWASEHGDEAVIRLLIEKGADLEREDNQGRTPLSWAATNGDEAVIRLLIEKDADLESRDNEGRTPLSWAAANGHEAVVQLLIEKGVNLESRDKGGWTPLLWAVINGHEAVVQLLFDKSVDLESRDNDGRTPLSWAVLNADKEVVRLLIDKGADLESRDNNNQTPLSWAAINGDEAVVQLLVEKGAI